jgi:Protein of unknown function (DUF2442)
MSGTDPITIAAAADAVDVSFTRDALVVTLSDGRVVSAPPEWFPRLLRASPRRRRNRRLIGRGIGWRDMDEDISVRSLLAHRNATERPEPHQV